MDGNRRKLRNLLLYIGIPVVVLLVIVFLFSNRRPQQDSYKYSRYPELLREASRWRSTP